MATPKLTEFIDRRASEIVDFTCELIATPSPTPPGDERQVARLLLDRLDRLGLTGAVTAAEIPERPNLLYRLKGELSGPTLLYVAHIDTKPVGDVRDLWQTDPLVGTIKDGRLYGLGAADMKAAVAGMVYATAALKEAGPCGATSSSPWWRTKREEASMAPCISPPSTA